MPRYYFETNDGDIYLGGDEGIELPGPKEARREALSALPDMARDTIPDGDERTLKATVRDETNAIVFEGTLTLKGTWHPK